MTLCSGIATIVAVLEVEVYRWQSPASVDNDAKKRFSYTFHAKPNQYLEQHISRINNRKRVLLTVDDTSSIHFFVGSARETSQEAGLSFQLLCKISFDKTKTHQPTFFLKYGFELT